MAPSKACSASRLCGAARKCGASSEAGSLAASVRACEAVRRAGAVFVMREASPIPLRLAIPLRWYSSAAVESSPQCTPTRTGARFLFREAESLRAGCARAFSRVLRHQPALLGQHVVARDGKGIDPLR